MGKLCPWTTCRQRHLSKQQALGIQQLFTAGKGLVNLETFPQVSESQEPPSSLYEGIRGRGWGWRMVGTEDYSGSKTIVSRVMPTEVHLLLCRAHLTEFPPRGRETPETPELNKMLQV